MSEELPQDPQDYRGRRLADDIIPDAVEFSEDGGTLEIYENATPMPAITDHIHPTSVGFGFAMLNHETERDSGEYKQELFAYLQIGIPELGPMPPIVMPVDDFAGLVARMNVDLQDLPTVRAAFEENPNG